MQPSRSRRLFFVLAYGMTMATAETSWENSLFLLVLSPSRSTYIMSTGDTRRSQLAIFFNNKSKQGKETSNRTSKRKREEQTLTILVEQASTCTIVNEDANQMTSSL